MSQKPRIKLKRPTPGVEVAVERGATEIETIDSILTDRLSGDYNLYRDVLLDWMVFGAWGQRQTALTKLERQVIPHDEDNPADVEAAEFIQAQLARVNIDKILKAMHWGVFFGFSIGEVMWGIDGDKVVLDNVLVRDRAKFTFDNDKQLLFTADGDDKPMPDRKFWTFATGGDTTDNPFGLGLAHFLFWPVLFKKSNVKFWLVGNEKAATSVPHGQFDPRSATVDSDKQKLLTALSAIKNGAATTSPLGTTVELLKGESGAVDFEKLSRYMDEAIAIVTLGQVMTSQAVGGQYKADVQDGVKDDIIKADADLLCASFNETVVKWLTEWNFPNANPPKLWLLTKDEVDNQAQSTAFSNMAKLGYRPTLEHVKDTFGGDWEVIPVGTGRDLSSTNAMQGLSDKNSDENTASNEGAKKETPATKTPADDAGNDNPPDDFAENCPCGCGDINHLSFADAVGTDRDLSSTNAMQDLSLQTDITDSSSTQDLGVLDKLLHQSDRELAHLISKETATLLQIDGVSREALADELLDKFPSLSFSELESFLTKLIFIAKVAGEIEADDG